MSTLEHTATYSPEDDKLRIYPSYRLPTEEYKQLKDAGYGWAPKQGCFYAVWTPQREAVALDFADEIEDEDKSLVERAEERADRFETYSDNRAKDADRAHAAVKAIADNIPFGQPILVGHHSEKRARRDAKRIEQGMRRAVDAWETSEYWTRRAAGALANAKYKERPDVRARRIKGLEADMRKQEKNKAEAEKWLKFWSAEGLTHETAVKMAGYCRLSLPRKEGDREDWSYTPSAYDALTNGHPSLYAPRTLQEVIDAAKKSYPRTIEHCNHWIEHISNRLAYERAMLAEGGGLVADKFNLEIGGQIKRRGVWMVITKINKVGGVVNSVSVVGHWTSTVPIEDIQEYKAPAEGDTEKVQAATKMPTMCNYITENCATMTQAEYTAIYKDHKGSTTIDATDIHDRHRIRTISGFLASRHGGKVENQWHWCRVFISDAKIKEAPKLTAGKTPATLPQREQPAPRQVYQPEPEPEKGAEFKAMKEIKKAGVQTITAPQLFPTPPDLCARMVELADIQPGMTVLEPSAGTGNILQSIMNDDKAGAVVAVEINRVLSDRLAEEYPLSNVQCADFLQFSRGNYPVDRVIMNPPFENGADIKHIKHALTMLKPGGRLVAICAGGPRQEATLKPLADTWKRLPEGTFKNQGTNVSTILLTITKKGE